MTTKIDDLEVIKDLILTEFRIKDINAINIEKKKNSIVELGVDEVTVISIPNTTVIMDIAKDRVKFLDKINSFNFKISKSFYVRGI